MNPFKCARPTAAGHGAPATKGGSHQEAAFAAQDCTSDKSSEGIPLQAVVPRHSLPTAVMLISYIWLFISANRYLGAREIINGTGTIPAIIGVVIDGH